MPYDGDFYTAYEAYLEEDGVRQAHNWVFDLVMRDARFNNVIDLGCGLQEFRRFANPLLQQ